jgi:hypothetical protein
MDAKERNGMEPVTIIPYFIDKVKYLNDFNSHFEQQSACVTDGRMASEKSYFKIIRDTDLLDLTTDYYSNLLGCDARARYYWVKKGRRLWWHTDSNTQCSLNFILNGNSAQIEIAGHEDLEGPPPEKWNTYEYKSCLLDTTTYHSVPNYTDRDRILFKISIFDKSYKEMSSFNWNSLGIL